MTSNKNLNQIVSHSAFVNMQDGIGHHNIQSIVQILNTQIIYRKVG